MSNKTPYELRFDVLQMARDLEMHQYEVLQSTFWSTFNELEQAIAHMTDQHFDHRDACAKAREVADKLISAIPPMPTSHDINRRARELYEFVETK